MRVSGIQRTDAAFDANDIATFRALRKEQQARRDQGPGERRASLCMHGLTSPRV